MVKAHRLRAGIGALLTVAVVTIGLGTAGHTAPGDYAASDVNLAVAKGVAYLDTLQNANGSFGSSFPGAETAFALLAYGVLDKGDYTFLPPAQQTHVKDAVAYLLSTQNATDGSFNADGQATYDTGLALDALSVSTGADPGIPAAITKARGYLIAGQQAPASVTGNAGSPDCSAADQPPAFSGTDSWCGGWNYEGALTDPGRSDESNTGFALTGLAVTGGVPAAAAAINVDWQRHIQELQATNYFASRNDGGGDYEPGGGGFSSTANDTGSLLFGLGYDKVAANDAKVQAAMKFGTDVLDTYELNKATTRSGIAHSGMQEDGSCVIGASGCDWAVNGDGGYHYSLWALTKGFGQYIPPNLSDPTNWYAKTVDLLLSEQNSDGSWTADGRDDGSIIGATSFAIDALGLVGVPTHNLAVTKAGTGSGSVTSTPSGVDCGATCSASFTQGTAVTLTATPDPGSTFAGWSGDCTGMTCSVTMDVDHAVTATFTTSATPHTLTVTKAGDGSGTVTSHPTAINCGTTCSASFSYGTGVAVDAVADPGSTFAGWSGDCTGMTCPTLTMDTDHSVTATFTKQPTTQMLTVTKAGDGTGSITSTPAGIDCGATCSAPFAAGSEVTLTATADPGSTFVGWSGDCTGTACTVTMDADHAVTATFMQSAPPPECKSGHHEHGNKDCPPRHDHFHNVVIIIVFTRFADHFCHWWDGVWSGSNFRW